MNSVGRRYGPRTAMVTFRGLRYELDLRSCERAYLRRIVEGELDSVESLAKAAGVSRSTVARFFSGHSMSMRVILAILRGLGVAFDEVARPCAAEPGEEESG